MAAAVWSGILRCVLELPASMSEDRLSRYFRARLASVRLAGLIHMKNV